MLKIAISSRTLFHLEDGHAVYQQEGQAAFNKYMRDKEHVPLRPGVGFALVRKLLALNKLLPAGEPGVEVVLLSRNSPDAGVRVMQSARHYGLDIAGAVFGQGTDRFKYASALGVNLFLSSNPDDVRTAIERGMAAAFMLPSEREEASPDETVRIAFDGDAVLFSAEADEIYRTHGLAAFEASEAEKHHVLLGDGPFKTVALALYALQQRLPAAGDGPGLRLALVTARGVAVHERVLRTLRAWGLELDEAFFCGGRPKGALLQAFGADVFFDDTQANVDDALRCAVAAGHVPFGKGAGILQAV